MNNVANLRKAESIVNDKTALVSYDNHGYTVTFEYANVRKDEIAATADKLRSSFASVSIKGRKFPCIHIITIR